ncbi:MAG: hypothetical protein ACRD3W_27740 [Terriglobales bacterium]
MRLDPVKEAFMPSRSAAMRVMAERYLRLAKATHAPEERQKFIDYANVYVDLSAQLDRRESSTALPSAKGGASSATMVKDRASMLRSAADLFETTAAATADPAKRALLLEYAKLYYDMAVLADLSEMETEAETDDDAW